MMEPYHYKWWALIGLSLLSFTAFLDFTIVTTALPYIQKDLNTTVLELQWIMNIFAMVLCMFMIVVGRAGDIFGRKRIFFIGFTLFGIAAIGSGLSPSIHWLIFFRGIQGLGGAIIFTQGVALLPLTFPPEEQNHAIGIFSAFNGAGLALGPFIAGVLISLFNWRYVFLINIPIILVGISFCAFTLQPSPPSMQKIKLDWLGLILLVCGLGATVYGIIEGGQVGWDAPFVWMIIGLGVISLIGLIFVETYVENPLLDFDLFKDSYTQLAILTCSAAGFITGVFMFFDPLYLEIIRKLGPFFVGVALLFIPLVQVIISLFFQKLEHRFGVFKLIILSLGLSFIAAICHVFFNATISFYFVLFVFTLMGYTWAIANLGSISSLTKIGKPEKLASDIGTIFTFWNISGSIFLAIATVLFHHRETTAMKTDLTNMNIILTGQQYDKIYYLLSDPANAETLLKQNFPNKTDMILKTFESSFMSAFHWVAWFGAAVLFVFLLNGFLTVKNKK